MQPIKQKDYEEDYNEAYCKYGRALQRVIANFTSDAPTIAIILDQALWEWLKAPPASFSSRYIQLQQIARMIALAHMEDKLPNDQVLEYREKYYRFSKSISNEDRAIFYAAYFHDMEIITIAKLFKKPPEDVIAARNKDLLDFHRQLNVATELDKIFATPNNYRVSDKKEYHVN